MRVGVLFVFIRFEEGRIFRIVFVRTNDSIVYLRSMTSNAHSR